MMISDSLSNNIKNPKESGNLWINLLILASLGVIIYAIVTLFLLFSSLPLTELSSPFTLAAVLLILFSIIGAIVLIIGTVNNSKWLWYLIILGFLTLIILGVFYLAFLLTIKILWSSQTLAHPIVLQTVATVLLTIIASGILIVILSGSRVKTYFSIESKVNVFSIIKTKKKITIILLSMLVVTGMVTVWGFSPSSHDVNLVDVYVEPAYPTQGDNISLFTVVKGGAPFTGTKLHVSYTSYFTEIGSGGSTMEFIGNNTYRWAFPRGFPDGTEIWYCISSDGKILTHHTINVGHVERSTISSLSIENVTYDHEESAHFLSIFATVKSNATITSVTCLSHVLQPNSSGSAGSGGLMQLTENDTYTSSILLFVMRPPSLLNHETIQYKPGTIIYYRIAAKDQTGNTAVHTEEFTIIVD